MNGPFRDQTFTSSHAWYSRVPGCIFVHTVECKVAVVGCLNRQERLFITIKLWVSQFRSAFHIFLTSSFLTTAIVIIAIITFDGPKKILCFPPNVCGYDKLQNSKMGLIKNTWAQLIWKLTEETKIHGTVGEFKSANFQESQPSTSTIEAIHPAVEWSFPRWKVLWQRPNICATQTLLGVGAPRAFQCFAMNNASPAGCTLYCTCLYVYVKYACASGHCVQSPFPFPHFSPLMSKSCKVLPFLNAKFLQYKSWCGFEKSIERLKRLSCNLIIN